MVGRRLDGRSDDRPSARPGPPARRVDRLPPVPSTSGVRAPRPATEGHPVRSVRPAGPLVAEREPAPRPRMPAPEPPGRFRRFVHRYGWRAYAVPVLAVVTAVTLVDLALAGPDDGGTAGSFAAPASAWAEATASETPESVVPGPSESADVDAGPTSGPATLTAEDYVQQGQGGVSVVDGTSAVMGTGPLRRFAVEVEMGIDVDAQAFATAVAETLGDSRSWGHGGRMSFQRVGRAAEKAGDFDFKVTLISPGSMERYCPGVGTGGYTSCRYGDRAVINLARWATAVPHYVGDIATYRQYVINHEVGHVLGLGHVNCPGAGQPAPVMVQQTLDLQGCEKNAWPFP